jgi:hypothetical protein
MEQICGKRINNRQPVVNAPGSVGEGSLAFVGPEVQD